MTLDGYFEGPSPWSLEFHQSVWDNQLEEFSLQQLDEVGTLLFGRRTFEGMAAYWPSQTGSIADRMNGVEKVVASRSGASVSWSNSRVLEGDITGHLDALKGEREKKDVFVFGSAGLLSSLLKARAVDEIRLFLVPTIFGDGGRLFENTDVKTDFALIEARPFDSGGVLLRYARTET